MRTRGVNDIKFLVSIHRIKKKFRYRYIGENIDIYYR
jgi:hypothetical protein